MIICPECQSMEKHSQDFCSACGYPFDVARRGPARQVDEQTLFEGRASSRALLPAALRLLVGAGLLALFFLYVLPESPGWLADADNNLDKADVRNAFDKIEQVGFWIMVALMGMLGLRFLGRVLRIKRTRVKVTDKRIVLESGLVSRYVDDIDLGRVIDTTSRQNILERMLGIGRVTVRSNDGGRPMLVLSGMSKPQDLRELIRARMARLG